VGHSLDVDFEKNTEVKNIDPASHPFSNSKSKDSGDCVPGCGTYTGNVCDCRETGKYPGPNLNQTTESAVIT
jgi:hypothetical protein